MPETTDLFNEVANLRDQLDDMSRSVSAIARKSGFREDILAAMEKDPLLTEVFLLVDGRRTQKDIVEEIKTRGSGASQPTVSRRLDNLVNYWDLVRLTTRNVEGQRYVHTSLASDLRIARILSKQGARSGKDTSKKAAKKQ